MGKEKISIIVPVYNVEKYLCRCLDSILSQSMQDYVVFLIDDGSKDQSGEICDDYAEKDKRFVVVHQKNQGVSKTRQKALDMVSTDYVAFIDPDDYIEKDYLEKLYNAADKNNADLVWCDYVENRLNSDTDHPCDLSDMTREGLLRGILDSKFSAVLWNKLFRASIIKGNNICFEASLKTAEDILFVSKFVCHSSRFSYVNNVLYNYNMSNENSAINTFGTLKFKTDYASMLNCLIVELKRVGIYEALYPSLINCMLYCKDIFVFDSRYRDFNKYRALFPEVDKHLELLPGLPFFRKQALRFVAWRMGLLGFGCLIIEKILGLCNGK